MMTSVAHKTFLRRSIRCQPKIGCCTQKQNSWYIHWFCLIYGFIVYCILLMFSCWLLLLLWHGMLNVLVCKYCPRICFSYSKTTVNQRTQESFLMHKFALLHILFTKRLTSVTSNVECFDWLLKIRRSDGHNSLKKSFWRAAFAIIVYLSGTSLHKKLTGFPL